MIAEGALYDRAQLADLPDRVGGASEVGIEAGFRGDEARVVTLKRASVGGNEGQCLSDDLEALGRESLGQADQLVTAGGALQG